MSNAEEIKEYYRQFLMDGQQHSTSELFSFVRKNDKDNKYTDGMLAGALKTLVDKEMCYIQIERGLYQFVKDKENLFFQYVDILENTLKQLDNVRVDPFKFIENQNDKNNEKLRMIENCIESIKNTIDDLQGN